MTRASYMDPAKMSENIQGKMLRTECQQIIDSWGLVGVSVAIKGNYCTVSHPAGVFQCMRWDVMQRLNELALDSF